MEAVVEEEEEGCEFMALKDYECIFISVEGLPLQARPQHQEESFQQDSSRLVGLYHMFRYKWPMQM